MTRRLAKLFFPLMLLSLTAQPLLAQARALHKSTPPCQMRMMQQMGHQAMAAHGDCAAHGSGHCAGCDLCGDGGGTLFHFSVASHAVIGGSAVAAVHRDAFVSITLPVDSPPPRSL